MGGGGMSFGPLFQNDIPDSIKPERAKHKISHKVTGPVELSDEMSLFFSPSARSIRKIWVSPQAHFSTERASWTAPCTLLNKERHLRALGLHTHRFRNEFYSVLPRVLLLRGPILLLSDKAALLFSLCNPLFFGKNRPKPSSLPPRLPRSPDTTPSSILSPSRSCSAELLCGSLQHSFLRSCHFFPS